MDDLREMLGEEIKAEIQNLSELEPGSDEKSKAIDELSKLYRLKIEEIKADAEREDARTRNELEREKLNLEIERKESQRKADKLDRWLNVGVQAGLGVISLIAYDIWHRRGLKFEETGTVTSPQTRNLISKMLPKKWGL